MYNYKHNILKRGQCNGFRWILLVFAKIKQFFYENWQKDQKCKEQKKTHDAHAELPMNPNSQLQKTTEISYKIAPELTKVPPKTENNRIREDKIDLFLSRGINFDYVKLNKPCHGYIKGSVSKMHCFISVCSLHHMHSFRENNQAIEFKFCLRYKYSQSRKSACFTLLKCINRIQLWKLENIKMQSFFFFN